MIETILYKERFLASLSKIYAKQTIKQNLLFISFLDLRIISWIDRFAYKGKFVRVFGYFCSFLIENK